MLLINMMCAAITYPTSSVELDLELEETGDMGCWTEAKVASLSIGKSSGTLAPVTPAAQSRSCR
jgi:hypothetical protein